MHMNPASFPPSLIAKIVRCVEDAVGDDIQADIRSSNTKQCSLSYLGSAKYKCHKGLGHRGLHNRKSAPWPVGNAGDF